MNWAFIAISITIKLCNSKLYSPDILRVVHENLENKFLIFSDEPFLYEFIWYTDVDSTTILLLDMGVFKPSTKVCF